MNLNNHGLKKTKALVSILNELEKETVPQSLEDIKARCEANCFDLSTIYRIMRKLVDKGMVLKEINKNGVSTYLLIKEQHQHVLICKRCHKRLILDECPFESIDETIYKKTGFAIDDPSIELYGVCKNCQEKKL